jgi:isocitrate dehydrogenase (NAD+)
VPYSVTLIPGDGIGPSVVAAARRVLDATGVAIAWDVRPAGLAALERTGTLLPDDVLSSIRRNGVALKGPLATPLAPRLPSANVALRRELGLYAGVRPCRSMPGVASPYEGVDVVVIRENTEDVYSGIEFEQGRAATGSLIGFIEEETGRRVRPDAGISLKTISIRASERIARVAMDYARSHGMRHVTAAHKANIMKFSDGLFLSTARRVAAEEYPDLAFDDRIIDALCMQLVQDPRRFGVLVMPNLYGDVVSDLCAGLIGGLGVAPGGHIGDDAAVFEATHGAGPRIPAGRANPTALILSGALLLRHLGERDAADRVEAAVAEVVADGRFVTYDLKPSPGDASAVGTEEATEAILARVSGAGRDRSGR